MRYWSARLPSRGQCGVPATGNRHQFGVGSDLDESTTITHHDPISSPNSGQTVSHNHHRPTFHQSLERHLDLCLGSGIEVGRRFVEHQHRRVDKSSPRERDQLTLTR